MKCIHYGIWIINVETGHEKTINCVNLGKIDEHFSLHCSASTTCGLVAMHNELHNRQVQQPSRVRFWQCLFASSPGEGSKCIPDTHSAIG
jgi:hypothetical protein